MNNELYVQSLIDTGSVISLVPKHMFDKLSETEYISIHDIEDPDLFDAKFYAANGMELDIKGFCRLEISIETIKDAISAIFCVIDTQEDYAIIGTNIIDELKRRHVDLRSFRSCKTTVSKLDSKSYKVKLKQSVTVKSNYELHAMTKLHVQPSNVNRNMLFVPKLPDYLCSHIEIDSILVEIPSGADSIDIPLLIRNFANYPVKLKSHMSIGRLESTKPVHKVSTVQKQSDMSDEDFISLFDIDTDMFSVSELETIYKLLLKHKSVFALGALDMGCLKDYEYTIPLCDKEPVVQRYRPINPRLKPKVLEHLEELKQAGIIRPCVSNYLNPLSICEKKDSSIRACLDARKLNMKVISDEKPIPRISCMLSKLANKKLFSSVDLVKGYHQIKLSEESQLATAFSVDSGQVYCYQRLPFGIKSAGAEFQRAMETVLSDLLDTVCMNYLDDIICCGNDLEEQCKNLDLLFTRLAKHGLKLRPSKCKLFKRKIKFLGHEVSEDGIGYDTEKTEVIKSWPTPVNIRDVRKAVGFFSFYRKLIPNFSSIAKPLTALTGRKMIQNGKKKIYKDSDFVWGKEENEALEKLKEALLNSTILAHVDYSKSFVIQTDASVSGLGAVLLQEKNGTLHPIAYASRRTSESERAYAVHKLELLAIYWSVTKQFVDIVKGGKIVIYSDNNPLVYISKKLQIDSVTQRWLAELSAYDFEIYYKPGKDNTAADVLSRRYEDCPREISLLLEWCKNRSHPVKSVGYISASMLRPVQLQDMNIIAALQNNTQYPDFDIESLSKDVDVKKIDFSSMQKANEDISYFITMLTNEEVSGVPDLKTRELKAKSVFFKGLYRKRKDLFLKDGILCRKISVRYADYVIIVDRQCYEDLCIIYHKYLCHLGVDKVYQVMRCRFYCPNQELILRGVVKSCVTCMARKTLVCKNKTEMKHRPLCDRVMGCLAIDHLFIDNNSTYKLLVCVDEASRYMWAFPVTSVSAKKTVMCLVKNIFCKFGYPEEIHSDNSTSFVNSLMSELVKTCNIRHTTSVPYHSMGNPVVERCNQSILNLLGLLSDKDKDKWQLHCDRICFAYNSTIHDATGYSPMEIMFGRPIKLVPDHILGLDMVCSKSKSIEEFHECMKLAYESCKKALAEAQVKYKKYYDQKVPNPIRCLEPNDIVLIRNTKPKNKIDTRWSKEPFLIVKKVHSDGDVYLLKSIKESTTLQRHRNDMLPVFKSANLDAINDKITTGSLSEEKQPPTTQHADTDSSDSEDEKPILPRRTQRKRKQTQFYTSSSVRNDVINYGSGTYVLLIVVVLIFILLYLC